MSSKPGEIRYMGVVECAKENVVKEQKGFRSATGRVNQIFVLK